MIRSAFIAVTTVIVSALFAGFVVFDRTNAQTATVSPSPTVTTSVTVTPTPTGTVKGSSTTIPSGAPATGHGE